MTQLSHPSYHADSRPAFSIPAILAILCAIASFFFGAGLGMLLAILAMLFGVIGVVVALSPNVRGGMVSILSIVAGVIGIVVALFKLVF